MDEPTSQRNAPRAPFVAFATAVTCGSLAAWLGAGPAALRLDGTTSPWPWLAAAAAPLTTVAIIVLREAHASLRAFTGGAWGPFRTFASATFVLFAAPAYVLASLLHEKTHHRPLGAVTFALATLALLAGAVLVARRVTRVLAHDGGGGRLAANVAVHGLAVLLLFSGARLLHDRGGVHEAAVFVDVAALGLAAALGARPELVHRRPLMWAAPVALLLTVGAAVATPAPRPPDLGQRAPAFQWIGALLR